MKKLLIAIAAVALVFSFQSCRKDYTCTCTVDSQTISLEYAKTKKSVAEDACASAETTYKIGDPSASCDLK